jgi:hypothetical protein
LGKLKLAVELSGRVVGRSIGTEGRLDPSMLSLEVVHVSDLTHVGEPMVSGRRAWDGVGDVVFGVTEAGVTASGRV